MWHERRSRLGPTRTQASLTDGRVDDDPCGPVADTEDATKALDRVGAMTSLATTPRAERVRARTSAPRYLTIAELLRAKRLIESERRRNVLRLVRTKRSTTTHARENAR